jgi:hypothetical protein
MSLEYRVDAERRLVVISGEFGAPREWLTLVGRLLKDRRVNAGHAFLRDLRGVNQTHSASTVLAVFYVVQRFWPNFKPSRGAIVTDERNHYAGQVAQALADTNQLPIRLFTSYDDAVRWLTDPE